VTHRTIPEEPSYETLMARLVAVVERLENGELPLAEALALYEEGMTLSAACQQLLEAAELRVQQLVPDPDGISLEDWNGQAR
jgi:exodeoxyribonuclease VII small subunit